MAAEVFASLPATVIGFASGLGLDRQALLTAAGLTEADLEDPDGLVPYDALIGVWTLMQATWPDRAIGLEYAAFVPLAVFGAVGYAIQHSPTAREALQAYLRYLGLIDPFLRVALVEDGDAFEVRLDTEPRAIALEEPIEMMLASMTRTAVELLDRPLAPLEVTLRHARRHDPAAYARAFSAPVRFGAPRYALRFETTHLDLPLPNADPALGRYLAAHLDAQLEAQAPAAAPTAFPDQVAAHLEAGLAAGRTTQAEAAEALHVSVRTLQRRLEEAGTSFSAVLDGVRQRRATQLLVTPHRPVAEVAYLLGYTEPRAFHRSFRRWTGQTPTAWRAEHGAK